MEGLVTSSSSSAARSYLPQKRAAETASCQEAKRISLEYPGPAALADLTKKLQDEAEQRRLEAEKRKLELSKEKVKSGFLQLLREEAGKIEKLMKDKGMENDVQTGLLESLEEKIKLVQVQEGEVECQFFYNPFRGADEGIGSMNTRVMSWLRSFDTKRFQGSPCYAKYVKQIDFQPLRILDWALTFYRFFLNGWMEDGHSEAGNVREHVGPQQRLISYLLLQSLDPVTPDLKLMIEERLQKTYRTTCPDVVAIFGSKILPRIRKTLEDEEFARLSKQNLTKACVFEYMSNRKTYDKAHDETPETTYMRDVLNTMLDDLLTRKFGIPTCRHTKKTPATRGAPVLKREVNDDGTDALYFANPEHEHKPASAGKRIVMLRQPNTKAADLFDLDVVNKAVSAMKAGEDGEAERKVYPPTPAAWLQRIFALFRTLHFRIDRKLTSTGAYPRYGVDEGLREADKDPPHAEGAATIWKVACRNVEGKLGSA